VRTTLSRYADVDPRRWRFRTGPQGKPEIAGPAGAPPLRFNLSHTRGLVACVVTLGLDAGVDVERTARHLRDPLALARHGFAPAERAALTRLAGRARRELFFDIWTLKEAYVKARGAGFLALPARKLAYEISPGGSIGLTIEPELEDRSDAWQVALLAPTADHRLAVAIRRGSRPDLLLVTHEIEPPSSSVRRLRPKILGRSPAPSAMADAAPTLDRIGA
jgi:4'-phosphopantetheinyl transferase